MSSGQALLQQLLKAHSGQSHDSALPKKTSVPAKLTLSNDLNVRKVPNQNSCITLNSEHSEEKQQDEGHAPYSDIIIEVCGGADCRHSGGGAAFLEIEELVSEYSYKTTSSADNKHTTPAPRVNIGPCRHICSVGPNVHVSCNDSGNPLHFGAVNSPQRCSDVMKKVESMTIGPQALPNSKSSHNPNPNRSVENACDSHVLTRKEMTRRMGIRRVERLRWEALKVLASANSTMKWAKGSLQKKQKNLQIRSDQNLKFEESAGIEPQILKKEMKKAFNLLEDASNSELNISASDPKLLARANRRAARFKVFQREAYKA